MIKTRGDIVVTGVISAVGGKGGNSTAGLGAAGGGGGAGQRGQLPVELLQPLGRQ